MMITFVMLQFCDFLTFTLVCVTERFLRVQADADVSRMSRWRVRAGSGAVVVTAATGSRTLRPGRPAWPRPLHWKTALLLPGHEWLISEDTKLSQTWARLSVAVLILDRRSATGERRALAIRCGAGALACAEAFGALFGTSRPRFPWWPGGSLNSCHRSTHSQQVLN